MTDFSRDPDSNLSAARSQRYRGVLFEQGTPVLDRDLNLLGDLVDAAVRDVLRRYAGDGLVGSPEAFEVTLSPSQASWKKAKLRGPGTMLVGGREITISQPVVYDEQLDLRSERSSLLAMWEKIWSRTLGESEKQALRDLLLGDDDAEDVPADASEVLLYLDVWDAIIDAALDPTLANPEDVGVQTSRRRLSVWRVRVTTGTSLPEAPRGHDFVRLAAIKARVRETLGPLDSVTENARPRPIVGGRAPGGLSPWTVTDFRRFGLQRTVEALSWTDGTNNVRSELKESELSLLPSDPDSKLSLNVSGVLRAKSVYVGGEGNPTRRLELHDKRGQRRVTLDADGLGPGIPSLIDPITSYIAIHGDGPDSTFLVTPRAHLYVGGAGCDGAILLRSREGAITGSIDASGLRLEAGEVEAPRASFAAVEAPLVRYFRTDESLRTGDVVAIAPQTPAKVVRCRPDDRTSVVGVVVELLNGKVAVAVAGSVVVRANYREVGAEGRLHSPEAGIAMIPDSNERGAAMPQLWRDVSPGSLLGKLLKSMKPDDTTAEVLLCLG